MVKQEGLYLAEKARQKVAAARRLLADDAMGKTSRDAAKIMRMLHSELGRQVAAGVDPDTVDAVTRLRRQLGILAREMDRLNQAVETIKQLE